MQQVNLYQAIFRRDAAQLSSAHLLRAAAGFAALLAILYAHTLFRFWQAEWRASDMEARRAELSARLQELQRESGERRQDAALAAEVDALGREVRAKERLLALLAREMPGSMAGFSPYLSGLARQRVEGVWLRRIQIDSGGRRLALAGSALDGEAVPDLIEKLGLEPAFAGRSFQRFLLEDPEGGSPALDFELDTQAPAGSEAAP